VECGDWLVAIGYGYTKVAGLELCDSTPIGIIRIVNCNPVCFKLFTIRHSQREISELVTNKNRGVPLKKTRTIIN
jgi:hypothetical protein